MIKELIIDARPYVLAASTIAGAACVLSGLSPVGILFGGLLYHMCFEELEWPSHTSMAAQWAGAIAAVAGIGGLL